MATEPSDAASPPSARHFSFAFQPIVNANAHKTVAYEALIRHHPDDQNADHVLGSIPAEELPAFDSYCRGVAIALATRLQLTGDLNLNLLPQTLLDAKNVLDNTVQSAVAHRFEIHRVVLEITESVLLADREHFAERMTDYRAMGVKLAMDDFGSGYSGLNLLADFQPDQLKIDHNLVRAINSSAPRQAIARAIIQICHELNITLIAEGVETLDEYHWFCDEGVHLFQGYLFARPAYEALPTPEFPGYAMGG